MTGWTQQPTDLGENHHLLYAGYRVLYAGYREPGRIVGVNLRCRF